MLKQDYYNDFFEIGQLKINFSLFELGLPDDDPVYTLKKVMEDLDFSGLLACYSDKGRTGFNPIMLYSVVTYANMRGVRAVDRIVELCERDLAFIWLTKGQKPKRDVFYDFKGKKLTGEVLDELNYQFMRRLEKEGLITLKELYIDGTKIEANANRYPFVWRGTLNYHLAGLLDTIDTLYAEYNTFLHENGYGPRYDLGDAHMFVIEGMEKVRKVIEKNRKRSYVLRRPTLPQILSPIFNTTAWKSLSSAGNRISMWAYMTMYGVIRNCAFISYIPAGSTCSPSCPIPLHRKNSLRKKIWKAAHL